MSVYEQVAALALEIGRTPDFVLAASFAGMFFLGMLCGCLLSFLRRKIFAKLQHNRPRQLRHS